ncbi:MAG TPA: SDR family oxidoreductase [Anaerolineaceae bacterium]|nr:SDR family oxidoreductase [Anaerolineaceae bacterium]
MDLKNRVAIITGASGGMGSRIAKALAKYNTHLTLVGRNVEKLQGVAQNVRKNGSEALIQSCDICSESEVEKMVAATVQTFGTVDILVNSAFWGPPANLEQTTEELWDKTIDTTLKAPYLCARAVTPIFKAKREGRIVNIGSKAGKVGEDNRTAYCAAKWGLEGLTAALSVELLKYNIHVHLISPAATNTPWWPSSGAVLTPEVLDRMIPPEVIAEAVIMVLSQPDNVHIPDVPIYNYRNPFEGKDSPFAD